MAFSLRGWVNSMLTLVALYGSRPRSNYWWHVPEWRTQRSGGKKETQQELCWTEISWFPIRFFSWTEKECDRFFVLVQLSQQYPKNFWGSNLGALLNFDWNFRKIFHSLNIQTSNIHNSFLIQCFFSILSSPLQWSLLQFLPLSPLEWHQLLCRWLCCPEKISVLFINIFFITCKISLGQDHIRSNTTRIFFSPNLERHWGEDKMLQTILGITHTNDNAHFVHSMINLTIQYGSIQDVKYSATVTSRGCEMQDKLSCSFYSESKAFCAFFS